MASHTAMQLVVVVVVALLCAVPSMGLKMQLEPSAKKCLGNDLTKDVLAVGDYAIAGLPPGVPSGVEITVSAPSGTVIFQKSDVSTGKMSFTATEEGVHQLCFANRGQALRVLVFNLKTGVEAKDYSDVAKKEHLQPLEVELRRIEDSVAEIYDEMRYQREREEAMRNTNESTNSRVLWYSIFTIVVLLSLGVMQLMILRRDFKAKKII